MKLASLSYYGHKAQSKSTRIFLRDDYHCWYCGLDLAGMDAVTCNAEVHVDHKLPKAQGGDDSPDNLVTCCRACNLMKGNRTIEQFREVLTFRAIKGILQARHQLTKASKFLSQNGAFLAAMAALDKAEARIIALKVTFYGELSQVQLYQAVFDSEIRGEFPQ